MPVCCPSWCKHGFASRIYATRADRRSLLASCCRIRGHIQETEVEQLNRRNAAARPAAGRADLHHRGRRGGARAVRRPSTTRPGSSRCPACGRATGMPAIILGSASIEVEVARRRRQAAAHPVLGRHRPRRNAFYEPIPKRRPASTTPLRIDLWRPRPAGRHGRAAPRARCGAEINDAAGGAAAICSFPPSRSSAPRSCCTTSSLLMKRRRVPSRRSSSTRRSRSRRPRSSPHHAASSTDVARSADELFTDPRLRYRRERRGEQGDQPDHGRRDHHVGQRHVRGRPHQHHLKNNLARARRRCCSSATRRRARSASSSSRASHGPHRTARRSRSTRASARSIPIPPMPTSRSWCTGSQRRLPVHGAVFLTHGEPGAMIAFRGPSGGQPEDLDPDLIRDAGAGRRVHAVRRRCARGPCQVRRACRPRPRPCRPTGTTPTAGWCSTCTGGSPRSPTTRRASPLLDRLRRELAA